MTLLALTRLTAAASLRLAPRALPMSCVRNFSSVKQADYLQASAIEVRASDSDDFENVEWLKRNNDYVTQGEPIATLEHSKVTADVTAPATGYLTILMETGSSGKAGARIGMIRDKLAGKNNELKWGFVTVKDKERAVIWKKSGMSKIVEGPARVFLWGERIEPLRHFVADSKSYLAIERKDGTSEHVSGPVSMWFDPLVHRAVNVKRAIILDANEAIVIYYRDNTITRRVVYGPTVIVPKANEWVHSFKWSRHSTRHTESNKFFNILKTLPDKMDVDVPRVRSSDNAEMTVQLMVFMQLVDVEQLLDTTHDPLAEIHIAMTADVIKFVSGLTLDKFRQRSGDLNDLANFPQTVARAKAIGYRIEKITFRGIVYSIQIDKIMREALEADAALKLEQHKEMQKQTLADETQQHELNRYLRQKKAQAETSQCDLDIEKARFEQERLQAQQTEQAQLAFFHGLKDLGVDLTQYLVSRNRKLDKDIRISGQDKIPVHVHLDQ